MLIWNCVNLLQNFLIEASEESQLEAAIQASLKETKTSTAVLTSDSNNSDCELETFSDSASDAEEASRQNHSGSSKTTVVSVESDSEDTLSSSSSGLDKKPISKGKASINSRAVVKNGRNKKVRVVVSSDGESDLNGDDSSSSNSDRCLDNGLESISQESQSSTKSWKDYLGQDSGWYLLKIWCY